MDYVEEDVYCDICYGPHYTGYCVKTCTEPFQLKLLQFKLYLRCRRLAIDTCVQAYLPVEEYIPSDTFVKYGPSLLNEETIAKYYTDLAKIDENKLCVGDSIFWYEFKRWEYSPLEKFERQEFTLPVDLNCESAIQPDDISIMEDKNKDDEASITKEENEEDASNEEDVNPHSVDFIGCPIIEFVIKLEDKEEVYIVEFESKEIGRSYHIGEGSVKICRSNEEWSKVRRSKLSKASKAFFKIP